VRSDSRESAGPIHAEPCTSTRSARRTGSGSRRDGTESPGQGLGRRPIEIDNSGKAPGLRFTTGANSTVRLELVKSNDLVGSIKYIGAGVGRDNEDSLRLQRVD